MSSDKSMLDEAFVSTLRQFATSGTAKERELAEIALELYELTKWHQPVIDMVNRRALEALEALDGTG